MSTDKRILMIVNEFPPVGESGVQRPLKFLKYLDKAGWETFVITPRGLPKTVVDESLCADIPKRSKIYRTASCGFGGKEVDKVAELRFVARFNGQTGKALVSKLLMLLNHIIFPIDKQIGWVPFAYFKAMQVIIKHKLRNIYITAFPYSAFLVGILLKLSLGKRIMWVADYRDAWQFEPLLKQSVPGFRFRAIRYLDERVLHACDKAVFSTPGTYDNYVRKYPRLASKAATITNGYDEEDFTGLQPKVFAEKTLVYMGKIYNLQRPDIMPLLEAISEFQPELAVLHIGSLARDAAQAINAKGFGFYTFLGYKDHHEALEYSLGAKINLLVLNDDLLSQSVFPGKVFELIRLGRPLLALGPRMGVVKDLLEQCKFGKYVYLRDKVAIIEALHRMTEDSYAFQPTTELITEYSRKALSDKLVKLYD